MELTAYVCTIQFNALALILFSQSINTYAFSAMHLPPSLERTPPDKKSSLDGT